MAELKYAIEILSRNKKMDGVSKMLGQTIEAFKNSHLLIREPYATFIANKTLTKTQIKMMNKKFTEILQAESPHGTTVEVDVIPYDKSLEFQAEGK